VDSLLYRARHLVLTLALAVTALGACVPEEAGPTDEEIAELDSWAAAADGKSDIPNTWSELVAWLRDFYENQMTVIWKDQEHPATAAAAMTRIRAQLAQAGVSNPTTRTFTATVQRLRLEYFDHSEINIVLAPGKVVRLIGDSAGAGVFFDNALFKTSIGSKMCLTWSELETAVEASYLRGAYGADFVCHTVTEKVLRALDVGSSTFASQIRTYQAARYIWGPVLPSFNPQNPSDWDVACP
jgi:hypothetical protein